MGVEHAAHEMNWAFLGFSTDNEVCSGPMLGITAAAASKGADDREMAVAAATCKPAGERQTGLMAAAAAASANTLNSTSDSRSKNSRQQLQPQTATAAEVWSLYDGLTGEANPLCQFGALSKKLTEGMPFETELSFNSSLDSAVGSGLNSSRATPKDPECAGHGTDSYSAVTRAVMLDVNSQPQQQQQQQVVFAVARQLTSEAAAAGRQLSADAAAAGSQFMHSIEGKADRIGSIWKRQSSAGHALEVRCRLARNGCFVHSVKHVAFALR